MIKVLPLSRQFEDNFGNITNAYKGNAGDKIVYTFEVEESIYFRSDGVNTITCNNVLRSLKKLQFPNIQSLDGFAIGQNVVLKKTPSAGAVVTATVTIVNIDYDLLQIEFSALLSPTNANLFLYDNNNILEVYCTDMRENLYFNTNFTAGNTSPFFDRYYSNTPSYLDTFRRSLIDGTYNRLKVELGGVIVGSTTVATKEGYLSGNYATSLSVERQADVNTYTRSWLFVLSTIQVGINLQDYFNTGFSNQLNFYYDFEWYSLTTEENGSYYATNFSPTNTGWFNQAYLSESPNSEFISQTPSTLYFDFESDTYTVAIESVSANIELGACYIPQTDSYYKNKYFTQQELSMLLTSNGLVAVGVYQSQIAPNGARYEIEVLSKTYVANLHTITFKFRYENQVFIDFMEANSEQDRLFYIWLKVGNVNHLVYLQNIEKYPKVTADWTDLIPTANFSEIETDKASDDYPSLNYTDGAIATIEDNLLVRTIANLERAKIWESAKFEIIVVDKTDPTSYFVLETYNFDFSDQVRDILGVLNVNMSQPINENLPSTSGNRRQASIRYTGDFDDATYFTVRFLCPLVLNWRYWLAVNLPQTEPFSTFYPNQNRNYLNYITGDYTLAVRTTVENETQRFYHDAIINTEYDYNETHDTATEQWTGSTDITYYIASTGVQVPCLILDEICKVSVFVNTTQTATNPNVWGQITIEPLESQPRWLMSTNYAHDNNPQSPILPLAGEDRLRIEIISANEVKYDMLVDGSKLTGGNQKITLKHFNDSAKREQVRVSWEVEVNPLVETFEIDENSDDFDCCTDTIQVFSETENLANSKNDSTLIWKLLLGGDSIEFRLYDENDILLETFSNEVLPNQSNVEYVQVLWYDILANYGEGCYKIKLFYSPLYGDESETTWGLYELQEYSREKVEGLVNIRSYFNSYHDNLGINFADSKCYDSFNVAGAFGFRDPKTEVKNFTYGTRLTVKSTRENLNEYDFTTNPITRVFTRLLLDLHFLSENDCYITDNNSFNHESYVFKRVIFESVEKPTYHLYSKFATVKAVFKDKIKNQRSSYGV